MPQLVGTNYFVLDVEGLSNMDQTLTERFLSENNDCTVIAISQAFNIHYNAAHELCRVFGRTHGNGFHVDAKLLGMMKDKLVILPQYTGHQVRFVLRHTDKLSTYIVLVPGHMFCVKNNQSQDGMDNSHKTIRRIFKVIEAK